MAIQDDPLLKEFKHQIGVRRNDYSDYVARGKCASFDDYKKRSGIISGLELALDILDEVIKNYGKEDESE